jgi:hypothetical protein
MKPATENQLGLHRTLATIEPPVGLYAAIMTRIDIAKRRSAQMRSGVCAAIALLSAAALVPVVEYTLNQLYTSGFYDYLSLMLSDNGSVVTYWREFGLSLLESLPSIALLLLLPIMVALIWSLVRLVKNARTALMYA